MNKSIKAKIDAAADNYEWRQGFKDGSFLGFRAGATFGFQLAVAELVGPLKEALESYLCLCQPVNRKCQRCAALHDLEEKLK